MNPAPRRGVSLIGPRISDGRGLIVVGVFMISPTSSLDTLKGRRVLVTGHTGFKGGWMCLWLKRLGADVTGIALPPKDDRDFFYAAGVEEFVDHRIGDIRDPDGFAKIAEDIDADLVLHMAAQPLVRLSYETPVDTYLTNVVGTAVVLEAARKMPSLKAAIVVTSDKCYENNEWVWGYRESDPMGGADPYSSSKGCTELVASAYRRSFFSDEAGAALASVRAGNVFGGGDWSADRLIPDIMKAAIAGEAVTIRNPASIRPWQHVLEPVWGYLQLAARLLDGDRDCAEGWNFGPDPNGVADVGALSGYVQDAWGGGKPEFNFGERRAGPHEAQVLRLDSTKAKTRLGWTPLLSIDKAIALTVDWYKASAAKERDMHAFSSDQIEFYTNLIDEAASAAA